MMPDIVITLGAVPEITAQLGGVTVHPVIGDAEPYEGEYSILPMPEPQTLPTAQKYCAQDIQVRGIPFYEGSNDSGGTTVIIDKLE